MASTESPSPLPSERDQNFLLQTAAADRFVLKIANSTDGRASSRRRTPRSRTSPGGRRSVRGSCRPSTAPASSRSTSASGVRHFVRLLTWLDGVPLGSVPRPPAGAARGSRRRDRRARHRARRASITPPSTATSTGTWRRACRSSASWRRWSRMQALRALVARVAHQIESRDAPRFARLRRAAVHNDPNDYNVLVSDRKVTGILDFGDIVHSYAIADLAIAIAYAVLGKPDPLAAAVSSSRGYQADPPAGRRRDWRRSSGSCCCGCARASASRRGSSSSGPDDAYLSVSQGPIARTLPALGGARSGGSRGGVPLRARPDARKRRWRRAAGHRSESVGGLSPPGQGRRAAGCSTSTITPGGRYLDAYNNVPHVGHSHPRVVQAAIEQMLRAQHQHALPARQPRGVRRAAHGHAARRRCSVCYFVNSGSEANELALRLARAHTRRRDVIVLDAAYHGNTTTLVDISPYKFNGPGGEGAPPWVHVLPLPDTYRGKYRRDDPRAGEKYAEFARQVKNPSAFIAGERAERRRADHPARTATSPRLRHRPRRRRRLHRGRSADGVRPDGHALLRVRGAGRRSRHRRARQADRQRLSRLARS